MSLIHEGESRGRVATLNCALSQAYGWAGLTNEALAANTAAMHGLPFVERSDNQFLGYNVEHWVMAMRGQFLVRLGRLAEAKQRLDRLLDIETALADPTVQFIPHLAYLDLAWYRGDAELAKQHAARVVEIGEMTGIPYLRVFGFACAGTTKALAKDFVGATQEFSAGLVLLRQTRASMSSSLSCWWALPIVICEWGSRRRPQPSPRNPLGLRSIEARVWPNVALASSEQQRC